MLRYFSLFNTTDIDCDTHLSLNNW